MGASTSKSCADASEQTIAMALLPEHTLSLNAELTLVVDEKSNPSFSDSCSSTSFEIEDFTNKECDYQVINRVKKEKLPTEDADEEKGTSRDADCPCGSEKVRISLVVILNNYCTTHAHSHTNTHRLYEY